MSMFWGRQCAFVFPIYVRKYRNYTIDRLIVVYTECASAVISPLRQWLDFYAKTRLKMWHTFKHFIHMQNFLLSTNLVIVFVHWISTGVLYEPRQCSLFWDYIPESKLWFCLNLCHPPGAYSIRTGRTVSWMVSSFSASCSWRPLDWRIRHSHLASTLFHSLVPWWRPRRIRPQMTRLSQLENSTMDTWPIYKNFIIPNWF